MKYNELLLAFTSRPFFETADLLTLFNEREEQILPRISRWVSQEKLIQLRRGKYLLPELFQKVRPHPFYISNYLYSPSYISLYTALEYYKLIPEHTPMIQAITTRNTKQWQTPYGNFHYHSLKRERFSGYTRILLGNADQQVAHIALPEKALVDICLLSTGIWDKARWQTLRLQNTEALDLDLLVKDIQGKSSSSKLHKSMDTLIQHLMETR